MVSSKISLVEPIVGEDEVAAVSRILRSGQLAQGPEVARFEEEFAALCGVRHAVAVNSGTAAVHCALSAVGVAAGDEVVTTPFTFAATATPILMQGARPRFVDIDPKTFNLDPDAVMAAIGARTKAVVAVDLFGQPISTEFAGALRERSVPVVEDACQAVGAAYGNTRAGGIGDVAAFSFYATKNLMTGEGGMLTTDDDAIAAAARRFRQHGQGERYEYLSLGYNYRMTDMSAAINGCSRAAQRYREAAKRKCVRVRHAACRRSRRRDAARCRRGHARLSPVFDSHRSVENAERCGPQRRSRVPGKRRHRKRCVLSHAAAFESAVFCIRAWPRLVPRVGALCRPHFGAPGSSAART